MNLTTRLSVEKKITKLLLKTIIDMGYSICVDDGGERHFLNGTKSLAACLSVDEATVLPYIIEEGQKRFLASFYLVYGNDGWDCIDDYSFNDVANKIMDIVEPYCDKLKLQYG